MAPLVGTQDCPQECRLQVTGRQGAEAGRGSRARQGALARG